MSAEGSGVKGSSQQSSTSGPKVKGGGDLPGLNEAWHAFLGPIIFIPILHWF